MNQNENIQQTQLEITSNIPISDQSQSDSVNIHQITQQDMDQIEHKIQQQLEEQTKPQELREILSNTDTNDGKKKEIEEENFFVIKRNKEESVNLQEIIMTERNQINYLIQFFTSSKLNDIMMFHASKQKIDKKNKFQIKFFFYLLKAKKNTPTFQSEIRCNFQLISVAVNDMKDCILFVLKLTSDKGSRYGLFYIGSKSPTEAIEIELSSSPIEDYFTIEFIGDEKRLHFVAVSTQWIKIINVSLRTINKSQVITSFTNKKFLNCSFFIHNKQYYSITNTGIVKTSQFVDNNDKYLPVKVTDSIHFQHFTEIYLQYRSALNVKSSLSELEQASYPGIDKQTFPLKFTTDIDCFGNEMLGSGPIIIHRMVYDKMFLVCLSKHYCIILISTNNTFECVYEDYCSKEKYINIIEGFELFFILSENEMTIFNATNCQYIIIPNNNEDLRYQTTIGEIKNINNRKIITLGTKTYNLDSISINKNVFEKILTPKINYTFLTHGFYPSEINQYCHIDFKNIRLEDIMQNILFQMGYFVMMSDITLYKNALGRTVTNEGIYRTHYPDKEFETSKFSTLLPFLRMKCEGKMLSKEEWKAQLGEIFEKISIKKNVDYKLFTDAYYKRLEEVLRGIRRKFHEEISDLREDQIVFETILFNGCMNKVIKEIGIEREEDYEDINIKFFELFPYQIIVQFDEMGVYELSSIEAGTLLNKLKVQAEKMGNPQYKFKEQLFLIRKISRTEQEFKEMVMALSSKRLLKPLEKIEKDPKRKHFNETSPDLLYKRKAEQPSQQSIPLFRSGMKPLNNSSRSMTFFKSLN